MPLERDRALSTGSRRALLRRRGLDSRASLLSRCAAVLVLYLTGCAASNAPSATNSSPVFGGGKGTPWTIRCFEYAGPDRSSFVAELARTLQQTPGIRRDDVFYHDEADGVTRLYYGTYYRREDSSGKHEASRQMRADLDLLKQLGDPARGQRYFLQAIPVRMPQPDVGNPAWRLSGVDGKYSLQVAVFEPAGEFWQFKQAAADFCQALRDEGYEAYYHHSPGSSVVTVGSFGPEAVIQQSDGRNYYTVYSPKVIALQQNELLKHNLLNGHVYKAPDHRGQMVPVPSRLVEIPRS